MAQTESTQRTHVTSRVIPGETPLGDRGHAQAVAAVACGALGIASAVWAFWLVLPGVILGIAAVALGLSSRRRGARETGGVAVALGIVAVLLVPSVLVVVSGAEDWGRDCALHPTNPDC